LQVCHNEIKGLLLEKNPCGLTIGRFLNNEVRAFQVARQ